MTQEQITIIRQNWDVLKPDAKQVGYLLYEKLFTDAPFLRPMFDEDITNQACKLAAVISFVVSKLHRLEDIFPDLQDIGAKHNQYNIPEHWYDVIGQCLITTLKDESGSMWNKEQEMAWLSLYSVLKEQMLLGQKRKNL
jgi:hemoglobin-like flavoprotein